MSCTTHSPSGTSPASPDAVRSRRSPVTLEGVVQLEIGRVGRLVRLGGPLPERASFGLDHIEPRLAVRADEAVRVAHGGVHTRLLGCTCRRPYCLAHGVTSE